MNVEIKRTSLGIRDLKSAILAALAVGLLAGTASVARADISVTKTNHSGWVSSVKTNDLAFSFSPDARGMLVVTIGVESPTGGGGLGVTSVTWSNSLAQTYPLALATNAVTSDVNSNDILAAVYYLANPDSGTGTVRAILSVTTTNVNRSVVGALYATGVGNLEARASRFSNTTNALTVGPIAVTKGALVVDAAAFSADAFTNTPGVCGIVGGGDTNLYNLQGQLTGAGASYMVSSSNGSYSAYWSRTSASKQRLGAVIVSFATASFSVTVTSPTNNQDFAYTVSSIAATAVVANAGSGLGVEFFADTNGVSYTTAGAGTSPTSTVTLTGPFAPGAYHVYAVATNDTPSTVFSSTNTFTVLPPSTELGVSVTAPANGQSFAYDVTSIAATAVVANAGSGLGVEFFTNGVSAGFGSGGSTSTLTLTGPLAPGTYTIHAVATNDTPSTVTSSTNTFTVLQAPTVSVSWPTNGHSFAGGVSITATATVQNGKSPYTVVFYTNGVFVGTDPTAPYTAALGTPAEGTYTIYAVVTDAFACVATSGTNQFTVAGVDMDSPTVTGVSVNDTLLDSGDQGAGKFVVTVTFSEAMTTNGTADPALTFAPGVGTTLIGPFGGWPNSTTYTARYDVAASATAVPNVTIDVTGAKDSTGNGQQDYTPLPEFSIAATPWTGGGKGGTVTNYVDAGGENWTVHIFTNVGPTTITFSSAGLVEYLVVAGGGGGSGKVYDNGGGGAGGMLTGTVYVTAGSHVITNGAGGAGNINTEGGYGGKSSFGSLVVTEGGGRGVNSGTAGTGGSGGGSGSYAGTGGAGMVGPPRQGYDGTRGHSSGYWGGGGGGAGGSPADRSATPGVGKVSSITGANVTYARGGSGGARQSLGLEYRGADAGSSTGNGGGGAGNSSSAAQSGGDGGSGIVVIRYPTPPSGTVILLR